MRRKENFSESVYRLTSLVPRGKVTTYGAIARALGKAGAARAVGQSLGANPHPIVVPCHRVVRSDGTLGGYSGEGGLEMKRRLLFDEGVIVRSGRVDLAEFLFEGFSRRN